MAFRELDATLTPHAIVHTPTIVHNNNNNMNGEFNKPKKYIYMYIYMNALFHCFHCLNERGYLLTAAPLPYTFTASKKLYFLVLLRAAIKYKKI